MFSLCKLSPIAVPSEIAARKSLDIHQPSCLLLLCAHQDCTEIPSLLRDEVWTRDWDRAESMETDALCTHVLQTWTIMPSFTVTHVLFSPSLPMCWMRKTPRSAKPPEGESWLSKWPHRKKTISRSYQPSMRIPVASHSHQHLVLSVFY